MIFKKGNISTIKRMAFIVTGLNSIKLLIRMNPPAATRAYCLEMCTAARPQYLDVLLFFHSVFVSGGRRERGSLTFRAELGE